MIRAIESDDRREIEIAIGETLELTLPETSGTGFRWVLTANGQPVLALEREYYADAADTRGGHRTHCWRFKAIIEGKARLHLSYARPWETSTVRSFTLMLCTRPLP